MDKTLLYDISYGLYIIGANENGKPVGCVANTVAQITSENPTIAISLNKNNYTYQVIEKSKKFSINILSEDINSELIGTFGFHTSKDTDKYKGIDYKLIDTLPVIKERCCGTLLCDVIQMVDMETHVILIARLTDSVRNESLTPMTYSYYHKVIKGKAPKNAPTYQEEEKTTSTSYVCSVCGFIHEGDIGDEPDQYLCPICKAPKSKFEKK